MSIIRLKTENEREMTTAFREAGVAFDEDGSLITATHDYFILMCGTLSKNTGVMLLDEKGGYYPEKVTIGGCHANLVTNKGPILKKLLDITVYPINKLIEMTGENNGR